MSKYHLKHQGPQIDALLDKAGTALQEHQDISHLAKKAEVQFELGKKQDNIEDIDEIRRGAKLGSTSIQDISHLAVKDNVVSWLSEKVDKIPGKQLTTEDFTTLLKQKLESLQNYDDTVIRAAIAKLRSDFDTLVESDTSGAIDKFNEIIAFLDGIEDSQSLDSIIASIEQHIAGKQSAITDLDTIRDGAAKGKTSVQGVVVNNEQLTPDTNGNISLPKILVEADITNMGFTKNKGTVTGVMVNGESKLPNSNGVVDLGEIKVDEAKFANDLTGVIEATPEMFTYRPSAGNKSVRDESAVIRRIKGNTSVWNQLSRVDGTLDFYKQQDRPPIGYWKLYTSNKEIKPSVNNGIISIPIKEDESYQGIMQTVDKLPTGTKVMIVTKVRYTYDETLGIVKLLNGYGSQWVYTTTLINSGEWYNIVNFYTSVEESASYHTFGCRLSSVNHEGIMDVAQLNLYNLTQIFGAGNEPTTYEEFRKYYPDAYYPYCPPEVRPMRATWIETIGFNAFNGEYAEVIGGQTYYLGGTIDTAHFATEVGGEGAEITIPENRLYTPSTNGYIYATGSDICINLSHSGVRNGEYKPYEKNTLLLPEIAKYFPDGMHGIGDVFDEINEEMAIQRCAVRAYEEGDENNAEVKTDKTITVYKISEPIYTPIDDPLQLAYKVDDFGTEKMLSDAPSSPFKADIVYQFNAEGRIRDNSRNIDRLEELLKRTKEEVDSAIASAITRTLNTPV